MVLISAYSYMTAVGESLQRFLAQRWLESRKLYLAETEEQRDKGYPSSNVRLTL